MLKVNIKPVKLTTEKNMFLESSARPPRSEILKKAWEWSEHKSEVCFVVSEIVTIVEFKNILHWMECIERDGTPIAFHRFL